MTLYRFAGRVPPSSVRIPKGSIPTDPVLDIAVPPREGLPEKKEPSQAREASKRYDQLVGVGAELEQEYLSRINLIKDMVGRAAVLREVINTTVKPVMVSP